MINRGRPWYWDAYLRFKQSICLPLVGSGAPTDAVTGAGFAGKGSAYIDYAAGAWYINTGTKASPVWSAAGSTAGAATPSSVVSSGAITSTSPSAGVGYATGAGGAVTQITTRATGVTMVPNPCICGAITTDTTSLAAEASANFIVTDSAVAIGDVVVPCIRSGSNGGNTEVSCVTVTAGTFTLKVANNNAAGGTAETGALIINFVILKAVSA